MASSVTDVANPQQGGKKDKDKANKDAMGLVEVNAFVSTLTGRVEDMEKHIEELESEVDMDELREEMQSAMTSIIVDLKDEIRAFRASETTNESELEACKAELEAHKAKVANYKAVVDAHKARIEVLEAQLKLCIAAVTNGGGPI